MKARTQPSGQQRAKRPSPNGYMPERTYVEMTSGAMLRTLRELQEMTQTDLEKASGVPQTTISALETDSINLGVERARKLAAALKVHPAILIFPDLGKADVPERPRRRASPSRKRPSGAQGAAA